jgi:hypothetical protein
MSDISTEEREKEQREQLSKAVNGALVVNRSEYAAARVSTLEAQLEAFREAAVQTKRSLEIRGSLGPKVTISGYAFDALMSALRNAE